MVSKRSYFFAVIAGLSYFVSVSGAKTMIHCCGGIVTCDDELCYGAVIFGGLDDDCLMQLTCELICPPLSLRYDGAAWCFELPVLSSLVTALVARGAMD